MSEEKVHDIHAASSAIYPIQFVQVGHRSNVPTPLARISTCGGVTIEVLQEVVTTDPTQGRYVVVTPQQRRQGSISGRNLLNVLVSLPGHYAAKGWLTEKLCRSKNEEDEDVAWGGMVRIDNIVTLLRGLLCPPGIEGEKELRKALVTYTPNCFESGPGYQLATEPLLWLDVDAIEFAVKQACLLEQGGKDASPAWERAYALASKGSYLPDEPYSDWAKGKRNEMDGYLRQAVHALYRLYLARDGDTGEEQALLLLRTYWQAHPTDEDVLRPLLELLGKRGCVQEAQSYYHHLCQQLEREECAPNPRTQQTMQNLQVRQNGHTQDSIQLGENHNRFSTSSITLPPQPTILTPHLQNLIDKNNHSLERKDIKNENTFPSIEQTLNRASLNTASMPLLIPSFIQTDVDILTRLSTMLSTASIVSEKEISYFDQQTSLYWRAREDTIISTTTLYTYVIRHIDDMNMLLARSHLPLLRSYLCEIVCRTVLLAGILLYDMGLYAKARQQYLVSFQAAREANNLVLQAIVWGWMSFTWTYAKNYTEALGCVQYARSFATQTTDNITQAWLGAIEAEIQAHLCNRDRCLQALSDMEHSIGGSPTQDVSYLFEFNQVLLLGYKGVCLQQFYQRQEPATHKFLQEAKESLERALASKTSIKRRLYYLNDLAGVYAREGDIEAACAYIIQSIPLMIHIGSGSKTVRMHLLQARTLLQPHEHTSSIQALDEQITPLLIGMQTEET